MRGFLNLLRHELRLHRRQKVQWVALVLFFMIVLILLPFALGPEPDLLRRLAPGLVWISALLMTLLALDHMFIADARDGTLDIMALSPVPLPLIILSKSIAQIVMLLGALAIIILPAALLLGIGFVVLPILALTLVLGVPSLILLGGIVAAVTIALQRNPAMLALLLIPFMIPILIFAVAACDAAAIGASALTPILFLAALLAMLLPSSVFIIAASLKHGQG
jgi:heme exporter protein B